MADRFLSSVRCASFVCGALALLPAQQFVDTSPPPAGFYHAPSDLDGDGFADLVSYDHGLRLHRNDGYNRFAAGVEIADLSNARIGDFADFDGDGDRDMVVFATSATAAPALAVHLVRNGGTTFTTTNVFQPPSLSSYDWMMQAVDIDNDGDQDVVCAVAWFGFFLPLFHVLANDGTGQFADVSGTWVPPNNPLLPPFAAADAQLLDVDGEGRVDLLFDLQGLRLWRNTGTAFVDDTATRLPPIAAQPRWSTVGDIDGDGDPDIFATPEGQPPMLLRNTGGVFTDVTATQLAVLPTMAQPAFFDADRDGDLDLYVRGAQPLLLANDGAGNFLTAAAAPAFGPEVTQPGTSSSSTQSIAVVDLERDGDSDLVLADSRVGVLRSDGAGNLVDPWAAVRLSTEGSVAMDFDGDGDVDLLTVEGIRANDGSGGFVLLPYVGPPPPGVAGGGLVGDLDGDGDDDFVSRGIVFNQGGGAFTSAPIGPVAVFAKALGDFDGDVDLDLVIIPVFPVFQPPLLYLNNGSGSFTPAGTLPVPATVWSPPQHPVHAADAEGDGDLDLVLAFGGRIFVLAQQGPATFVVAASTPGNASVRWVNITGGNPDIVATEGPQGMRILRLQAGGLIDITATVLPPGVQDSAIVDGDVDGDGDADLCGSQLLRNNGTGGFTVELLPLPPGTLRGLHDFDLDGDLDMLGVYGYWNGEHQVVLPLPAHIGRPLRVDVSALPGRATPAEIAVLGVGLSLVTPGIPLPFGVLRIGSIGLTLAIPITPVVGLTEFDLPIPPNPAFVGIDLHFQALHLGPGGLLLGNVASTRIQ